MWDMSYVGLQGRTSGIHRLTHHLTDRGGCCFPQVRVRRHGLRGQGRPHVAPIMAPPSEGGHGHSHDHGISPGGGNAVAPATPSKKRQQNSPLATDTHGPRVPSCPLRWGGGGGTEEGALTAPWPVPRSQTCETLSYTPKTVSRPTTPRLPLCLTSLSFSLVEGGGACGWSREGEGGAMGALRDGGA